MTYKPNTPFSTAMFVLIPTETKVMGVLKKTYPSQGLLIFGSFKTFGGTERVTDGVYSVEDTAVIETWYTPIIKADCRVKVGDALYEVIGTPENIEMRNQYTKFKVRRVAGGA